MPDPHANYGREYMHKSNLDREEFEFVEPETDEETELDLPENASDGF